MNIERCVWNIYTYATLHGNPRDPSRLTSTGLQKLCKECRLHDPSLVESPISPSQVHLIFAQEAKNASERLDPRSLDKKVVERVDYDGFLSCIMCIAEMCYPSSANGDGAMIHLLVDNILPLASRREPRSITKVLESKEITALFAFFEDAVHSVFDFYAANAANSVGAKTMVKITSGSQKLKSFEDHEAQISAIKNAKAGESKLKSGTFIGYEEFLRFSVDFGIASSLGLTTLDVGDIYLSVCSNSGKNQFTAAIRNILFDDFWEALVRCGLHAFRSYSHLSNGIKIKTLFLYMWRHIQSSIREQMQSGEAQAGDLSAYKGGLIRGAQLLNERFLTMWAKDGYKDYLRKTETMHSSVEAFLKNGTSAFDIITNNANNASKDEPEEDETVSVTTENNSSACRVIVDIHDDDDLGDDRLDPVALRQLLVEKPELATLLYNCADEAGLLTDDEQSLQYLLPTGSSTVRSVSLSRPSDEPDSEGTEDDF